jgi:DNA-binding XRE family transcriptional regulator
MAFNYRKLKKAREGAGLNRTQLSVLMGVTKQAVSLIEWGLRQHPPLMKRYADALGKRIENFQISDAEFRQMRDEDAEERKLVGSRK